MGGGAIKMDRLGVDIAEGELWPLGIGWACDAKLSLNICCEQTWIGRRRTEQRGAGAERVDPEPRRGSWLDLVCSRPKAERFLPPNERDVACQIRCDGIHLAKVPALRG